VRNIFHFSDFSSSQTGFSAVTRKMGHGLSCEKETQLSRSWLTMVNYERSSPGLIYNFWQDPHTISLSILMPRALAISRAILGGDNLERLWIIYTISWMSIPDGLFGSGFLPLLEEQSHQFFLLSYLENSQNCRWLQNSGGPPCTPLSKINSQKPKCEKVNRKTIGACRAGDEGHY